MGDLIFINLPLYEKIDVLDSLNAFKKKTPDWATEIKNSNLINSLTKYGDLYATDSSELPKIGGYGAFKSAYTLHLAFKEPFDGYQSMSIIEISGQGQNKHFALADVIKRVNNLWEYEDLLKHCFFSDVTPFNKYCYIIFDPQEIQRHKLMYYIRDESSFNQYRASIRSCGHIYTNALLSGNSH